MVRPVLPDPAIGRESFPGCLFLLELQSLIVNDPMIVNDSMINDSKLNAIQT